MFVDFFNELFTAWLVSNSNHFKKVFLVCSNRSVRLLHCSDLGSDVGSDLGLVVGNFVGNAGGKSTVIVVSWFFKQFVI